MTARNRTVLIFPASTEIGLEIWNALRHEKGLQLIGAGEVERAHAPFVFERHFPLPHIDDDAFLPGIIELCVKEGVDYVFPAHDDAIVLLAQNADRIPAKIVTSPLETCLVTRSKRRTYEHLAKVVRTPRLFDIASVTSFPVFIKPERGQGSSDAHVVRSTDELAVFVNRTKAPIVCEYLPGDEYTVDCFSDRDAGLRFVGARARQRTRNGIAVSTVPIDLPEAWEIAEAIASRLVFHGAWFFQLKRAVDGALVLLEAAPRVAGSSAAHRALGVNLPRLSIYESDRIQIRIAPLAARAELSRALANRYRHDIAFSRVYVDFDDTLVKGDTVNTELVAFLFDCVNRGVTLTLLTRHTGDIVATLARRRLGQLFDDVIHLRDGESKSAHIKPDGAIFIDDSFAERMEVEAAAGVPTFDLSMLELLSHGKLRQP